MLFVAVFLVALVADQLSKWWIITNFVLYESREIIPGFFNFTFLTNNGAAFSILAGQPALWRQVFFVTVNVIALTVIAVAQRRIGKNDRLYTVALALIAGGAAGNLTDRIRFAYVIDFLDVYIGSAHWPAFNIADAAINVGVALFLLNSLMLEPRREKKLRLQVPSV
ncbi:MAG: signal peptidase II [Desulfobulbaceae bacterium]|nr:signal peptidase II [Desulfobulbaceae bacterium]